MSIDLSSITTPLGVHIRKFPRSVSVIIQFNYLGIRIRECYIKRELPQLEAKTGVKEFLRTLSRDVKAAGRLLVVIQEEIARGTFDLAYHFPKSSALEKLGEYNQQATVEYYLRRYLERAETNIKHVSWRRYKMILENQLIPAFGGIQVKKLTAGKVRDWVYQKSLTTKRKTINNILCPFKIALDDAVMDGLIEVNPVRKINLDNIIAATSRKSDFKPDPFSKEERARLLGEMTGQIRNLFQFAFYTGLRTGELIGLKWEKIDLVARTIVVDESLVEGDQGALKTASKGVGSRTVLLLDPALEALHAQRPLTQMAGEYVFHNPFTRAHWAGDNQLRRVGWIPAFKKAGVRYRNPYQTRHTYAHIMIRQNENIWWIANQMGHTGIEMLNRHYGGWMEDSAKTYRPRKLFTAGGDNNEVQKPRKKKTLLAIEG